MLLGDAAVPTRKSIRYRLIESLEAVVYHAAG